MRKLPRMILLHDHLSYYMCLDKIEEKIELNFVKYLTFTQFFAFYKCWTEVHGRPTIDC